MTFFVETAGVPRTGADALRTLSDYDRCDDYRTRAAPGLQLVAAILLQSNYNVVCERVNENACTARPRDGMIQS